MHRAPVLESLLCSHSARWKNQTCRGCATLEISRLESDDVLDWLRAAILLVPAVPVNIVERFDSPAPPLGRTFDNCARRSGGVIACTAFGSGGQSPSQPPAVTNCGYCARFGTA